MGQLVEFGHGARKDLSKFVELLDGKRIFLVTGRKSYTASGAADWIAEQLASFEVIRFRSAHENPRYEDILSGIEVFHRFDPDLIVAVGGGSVMDVAKLVKILAIQEHSPYKYLMSHCELQTCEVPLIAIPTTAGSGSQATHFAVVYLEKTKHSIAHPCMKPDVAIVDPAFLTDLPRPVAAAAGLDALSQGIEAYWSIHATQDSERSARKAIIGAWAHLAEMVNQSTDRARLAMARAAHLAGEAINLTKTTGPHAVSYPITAYFGVRHGHAVGLTLSAFLRYNTAVSEVDCLHPLGTAHVRSKVDELVALLGASSPADAACRYELLMDEIGLSRDLAALNIRTPADIEKIVRHGFDPQRVHNNPRRLTEEALRRMLRALATGNCHG